VQFGSLPLLGINKSAHICPHACITSRTVEHGFYVDPAASYLLFLFHHSISSLFHYQIGVLNIVDGVVQR